MSDAFYSPLLTFMGGILAIIMIIVGMIGTPVVMQSLFAHGNAFTGQSANFAHMVSMGSRSIYGLSYCSFAAAVVRRRCLAINAEPPRLRHLL